MGASLSRRSEALRRDLQNRANRAAVACGCSRSLASERYGRKRLSVRPRVFRRSFDRGDSTALSRCAPRAALPHEP
jgi:hypothetical protein